MYEVARRVEAPAGARDIRHIAILNDYVRVPYATGSTFAAQFLHREFSRRGHDVTLVGPRDPGAQPSDLPERHVLFPSIHMRSQPGMYLPLPSRSSLEKLARSNVDVMVGQTGSALMEGGVWLRARQRVPLLCVNTTLLSRVYDTLLPESLSASPAVQRLCSHTIVPAAEQLNVQTYNQTDGLIVLSEGLEKYWRNLGVTVPIHVIPRTINTKVLETSPGPDPYPANAKKGMRVLVLCRMVREKNVDRIIDIFAEHVAPLHPDATLTLVGDGADHDAFVARAQRLGIADRAFFQGEVPVSETRGWYHHADVFVYASQSETYGQVISEAMACGLPVVAFDDGAGVAQQITHGRDGLLLPPGPDATRANARFGAEVNDLLEQPKRRAYLSDAAKASAMRRADPQRCINRYYEAFASARAHIERHPPEPTRAARLRPLLRWGALHAMVGVLCQLRSSAPLNRNGRSQPAWIHGAPSVKPGGEAA